MFFDSICSNMRRDPIKWSFFDSGKLAKDTSTFLKHIIEFWSILIEFNNTFSRDEFFDDEEKKRKVIFSMLSSQGLNLDHSLMLARTSLSCFGWKGIITWVKWFKTKFNEHRKIKTTERKWIIQRRIWFLGEIYKCVYILGALAETIVLKSKIK